MTGAASTGGLASSSQRAIKPDSPGSVELAPSQSVVKLGKPLRWAMPCVANLGVFEPQDPEAQQVLQVSQPGIGHRS